MDDLISRQAAINGLYEMASDIDHLCTVGDYINFLESLSSAKPTAADCWGCKCSKMERLTERSGKWIVRAETFGRRTLYYYTCPLCGSTKHQRTKYCPDCGCDMRGKDE